MKKLEEKIGYTFQDLSLLENALNHSSYANENRDRGVKSNERLEFLGDSVLGLTAAEHLYREFPEEQEGNLTKQRAALVREESLYLTARELGLGDYLHLGHGELLGGGRERPSILADAVEAVIAAIYLDGGFAPAREFIERHILCHEAAAPTGDYKTLLQEKVQRRGRAELHYVLTGTRGPDHRKEFFVDVLLNGEVLGSGRGTSKKEAEQNAAQMALKKTK